MDANRRTARMSVAGCCMGIFWSGAIAFAYPGIMSTYWQERFQVDAGATGMVVTIMLLAISVCTFFSGKFLTYFGIRKCFLMGTGLMLAAMLILINAVNIFMVYIWAAVVNLGASFFFGPGLTTVQKWMPNRKGLASGLLNLTYGLSAAIISPIWEAVLNTAGYEAVNISLIVCFLITNTAAILLVRSPEPLPEHAHMHHAVPHAAKQGILPTDLTAGQAARTRAFRMMFLCWTFVGAAGISMVSLSKGYAASLGLSSVSILMAFNVMNGVGRLISGELCDIVGGELTALTAFLIGGAGYLLLPLMQNTAGIVLLAACIGYGFGTLFAVTGPIASRHFGLKNFATIFGLIYLGYGLVGSLLGPLLSGIILTKAANPYPVIFSYLGIFFLLGAAAMAVEHRLKPDVAGEEQQVTPVRLRAHMPQ